MTAETLPREITPANPADYGLPAPTHFKGALPAHVKEISHVAIEVTVYPAEWGRDGACHPGNNPESPVDPELFFPIGTKGPSATQAEEAKAYCKKCPVKDACLKTAFESGSTGVWGGTTDQERRDMPLEERAALFVRVEILRRISK